MDNANDKIGIELAERVKRAEFHAMIATVRAEHAMIATARAARAEFAERSEIDAIAAKRAVSDEMAAKREAKMAKHHS